MNHLANSSMGRQDQPAVYIDEHGIIKSQNAAFRELIELKRGADSLPRDLVALLVKHWADQIEADAFASDAIDGINKARTLLGIK